MRQSEFIPKEYILQQASPTNNTLIHLQSSYDKGTVDFTFEAVRPGLFRTTFITADHPLPPFPSAARPEPTTSTFDVTGQENSSSKKLRCGQIEANVEWSGCPIVTVGYVGQEPLHIDLPFRSYVLDGTGIAHYTRYHRNNLYVGLGEKAAPMDLSNRHFTLSASDCFGYDVHRTDPMYKHIPLLIRATPHGVVATFSTSHSRGYYSIGSEMDGMYTPFKVYRQDHGGLELYTMVGRTLQEVVTLYADLVGYPLLVPRWSLGYLAGGMKYSMLDSPRASDALMEFASKLEKYDIPCSGFQMSSGYTVAETEPKTRNVFTWNRHRFPDPKGLCNAFHERGIRLIANIKPYILASHPQYENLVKAGALFKDPRTGASAVARLWSAGGGESGEGGHIDFTSKAGYDFWSNGVKELRNTGIDCMWNDNNEYVIPDDSWMPELSHVSVEKALDTSETQRKDLGLWGRAMHCELMGKASYDALLETVPHERPFVLTRSATAGTIRFAASSWSGDNVTSWDGMRGANALSLTAGMCLLQSYGHDIGGFEGPQPSPELLLRWVQLGIHSPRFAINCFKTGTDNMAGSVIEPWQYPEILPDIRKAIKRRYEIIPYLYSLSLRSHLTAVPPQRWVGWDYEKDPEVWSSRVLKDGETQYWLGDSLLVGGVYESGIDTAQVYLPRQRSSDPGFINLNTPYQAFAAGQWVTVSSPWQQSIPLLARIGGLIPVGRDIQVCSAGDKDNLANLPQDTYRGVEIFPPPEEHLSSNGGTTFVNTWLEDDGVSPPPAKIARLVLAYTATSTEVAVSFSKDVSAGFTPLWCEKGLTVILPCGDRRRVVSNDDSLTAESRRADEKGRLRWHLVPRAPSVSLSEQGKEP